MLFYQLTLGTLLAILPSIYFFIQKKERAAVATLLGAAFIIRLFFVGIDPFLHDWDERFHAIVAKNMMLFPLKPMIRLDPLLAYDVNAWCCNFVWVHKQPLFLWQMAVSMKIFGVNLVALRLPNVILGTFVVFCNFRIARIWTKDFQTAYLAALLTTCSGYILELTVGGMALDHNDLVMGAYVTASVWAFAEHTWQPDLWRWPMLMGLFSGAAILTKWLPGLLIFGGWFFYILLNFKTYFHKRTAGQIIGALAVCVAVFMPWQFYIQHEFPLESAASYAHNRLHITDDLGHPGNFWTHFNYLKISYNGEILLFMLIFGIFGAFFGEINKKLSLAMLAMFAVVFGFFSFFVKTKMPGLTFPVYSIGIVWAAIGVNALFVFLEKKLKNKALFHSLMVGSLFSFFAIYAMNTHKMAKNRNPENTYREAKIYNTNIYKNLQNLVKPTQVILNCKEFEDTEVRFWTQNNAIMWYPNEKQLDTLLQKGYSLAAIKSFGAQQLPDYILKNKAIEIIDVDLK